MERIQTFIPNLDEILSGGIPEYSINIISGKPGTGKTILAQQMIFNNAREGKRSVYLTTVSEPSVKVVRFQKEFDFFDADLLGDSVIYSDLGEVIRQEGTKGALNAITQLRNEYSPDLLIIDSFKALHDLVPSQLDFRKFLFELTIKLSSWNTTTFLVGEYSCEDEKDLPEFSVADSMICLGYKESQRYLEVKKMRGTDFMSGKHSIKIDNSGIMVYPHTIPRNHDIDIGSVTGDVMRVKTGIPGLDSMIGGGFLEGRSTLVTGSAGTGKSMIGLQFLIEGAKNGESGILVSFEEHVDEIIENSLSYGLDIGELIKNEAITVLHVVPVNLCIDEMLYNMKQAISQTGAKRVVIDGISNIEREQTSVEIRDTLYTIVDLFKENDITSILTTEVSKVIGSTETTKHGTSFIVDTIISLRYVEIDSEMKKALSIIKMRGSDHDRQIHEYRITDNGVEVDLPFKDYSGVLSGVPSKTPAEAFVEAFKKDE